MEILNPSTSDKVVMSKLQILLIQIVDTDIFQMTLKISLFTINWSQKT